MKRVALITGGSRGIGLGIAQHLAKNGFDIAINGVRDEAAVREVIQSLESVGGNVIYCQGSISSTEDRKKNHSESKRSLWKIACVGEQCRHRSERETRCIGNHRREFR